MGKLRWVLFGVLVACVLAAGSVGSAQVVGGDIAITEIDTSAFPDIQTRFRLLDSTGYPVSGVTAMALEVRENGQTVAPDLWQLRELEDGVGVRVHFVLDAGLRVTNDGTSTNEQWRQAVNLTTGFLQSVMIENLDTVAITAVERTGSRSIIDFTGDSAEAQAALAAYSPPGGVVFVSPDPEGTPVPPAGSYSNPLEAIGNLLPVMANDPEAQAGPQVIVLITPGIEQGGNQTEEVANQAQDFGIPIYTILTRTDPTRAELTTLSDTSGGVYAAATANNTQAVDELYRHLAGQRRQYVIVHRSRLSQAGAHQLEVVWDTGGNVLSDQAGFELAELVAPRVIIETPEAGATITRQATEYVSDTSGVEPTEQTVTATIIFPDGHERSLVSAQLMVDGAPVGALQRNPETRVQFSWDLRGITTEGTTSFSLQVEVRDELGLTATSPATMVAVTLIVPAPPPTAPSFLVTPTPTPLPCYSPDPLCSKVERPLRENLSSVTSVVSMAIAVAALIFAGVVWLNRGKVIEAGGRVGGAVTNFVERVTGRRVQAAAKAYLVVLEGDTNVGRSLEVYGDTPLGRSKQYAQLLFQQNDEDSPISRLHCTLLDEEDHFSLRDEDSANGTYLNGLRLEPLVEELLHDGDEIELAQVERGGVKLLFQLAERSGSGVPDSSRLTRPSPGRVFDTGVDTVADEFELEGDEF